MSRHALPSVFDHAPCGLVTTRSDGHICRANKTFCDWVGHQETDLVDKLRIQDLFSVGSRFFHHTHWAPLLKMQGSVAEVLMDVKHSQGEYIPMLVNASRQKYQSEHYNELAFFVATDRKKYEKELLNARQSLEKSLKSLRITQKQLEESQDFLSVAIRSARMGVWSQNLQSHEVWCSDELQQLIGQEDGEYLGSPENFFSLLHKADRDVFKDAIEFAVDSNADYDIQFRIKHANGNWLTMEGRGHVTHDQLGKAVSIFGIFIDITERKEAEQKLHEVNQQLCIADKRKDEFLATLAHELRNPLAPIQNVLEIMQVEQQDNQFVRWAREILQRHVSQMTHLVDDLLEASRISHGRLELRRSAVDLSELVQSAIDATLPLFEQNRHHLSVNLPKLPLTLDADGTRVVQIFTNLLNNAAKYTPPGGRIRITVKQTDDMAQIRIKDNGIGIPEEHLRNVFSMFTQLQTAIIHAQGGLGIGLSLVHGLVALHGGTITAHSKGENKGSEFVICLPLADKAMQQDLKNSPINDQRQQKKRILVIDDNTDAASTLAKLLEFNGHSLHVANDGLSGLLAAEEFNPEVVLLDIGLPDINGYQVACKIREQNWGKNMLLVATTGWGQESDKQMAIDAGFNHHLTKPIDIQVLKELLNSPDIL